MRGHGRNAAELRRDMLALIVPLSSGCWEWNGPRSNNGYGRMPYQGRARPAHQLVYRLWRGPIPEGLELDHLCRNTWCVNPEHLEPVTHRENTRRGRAAAAIAAYYAARTNCRHGLEYTAETSKSYLKQRYKLRYVGTFQIKTKRRMRV